MDHSIASVDVLAMPSLANTSHATLLLVSHVVITQHRCVMWPALGCWSLGGLVVVVVVVVSSIGTLVCQLRLCYIPIHVATHIICFILLFHTCGAICTGLALFVSDGSELSCCSSVLLLACRAYIYLMLAVSPVSLGKTMPICLAHHILAHVICL